MKFILILKLSEIIYVQILRKFEFLHLFILCYSLYTIYLSHTFRCIIYREIKNALDWTILLNLVSSESSRNNLDNQIIKQKESRSSDSLLTKNTENM